ncbi:MAG: AEC family transporter, partial [Propionibacteriaceae bacterium]|nr:AEC family transporter [Propionibacteriaceae bacterium]
PEGTRTTAQLSGWSMALRFGIVPGITVGIAALLGLAGPAAMVAVLFQSIPTASSAYVLARRLGGDGALMAAIIAVQTIAGLVTIPLWLTLAHLALA